MTSPGDEGSRLRKRRPRAGYEAIPNALLEDDRLSYKARGILASLLAKPDGWRVRAEAVERGGKEGREAIRSGIAELIAHGYYRRVRFSVRTERGPRWFTEVEISAEPVEEWVAEAARLKGAQAVEERSERRSDDGSPTDGKPSVGNPTVGSPDAVVRTQSQHSEKNPPAASQQPPPTPKRAAEPRGTRLPEDWTPSEEEHAFAVEQGLAEAEVDTIAAKFRDYWVAVAGQRGSKRNWTATWRNWVREEMERRAGTGRRAPQNRHIDEGNDAERQARYDAWEGK